MQIIRVYLRFVCNANDTRRRRHSDDSVGRTSGCHWCSHVSAHNIHMQNVAVVMSTTERLARREDCEGGRL